MKITSTTLVNLSLLVIPLALIFDYLIFIKQPILVNGINPAFFVEVPAVFMVSYVLAQTTKKLILSWFALLVGAVILDAYANLVLFNTPLMYAASLIGFVFSIPAISGYFAGHFDILKLRRVDEKRSIDASYGK